MIATLLVLLIILWLLGYVTIPFFVIPAIPIFTFNGQTISLWDIIIALTVSWIIGVLPSPFREIAGVVFILWILAELGILMVAGLSGILLIIIIVGLLMYLLSGGL